MTLLKCKMCGGDMKLSTDRTYGVCEYCGSMMTLPKAADAQRVSLFNRGNHFRMAGDFDQALSIYEQIVRQDETDAEAHWCCALCRFGIEYVEDPVSHEYIPTCHRASFDSFLEDVDYRAALAHSEGVTRLQYQKDAARIAEVQRGILATSQNEDPFDVFICYKETEENGARTKDSVLAQEIYYRLTEQGRRVFFSRITLEDKGGAQYEPYIFAALNSAKVMIVVGTSGAHLNAPWVKNEWSRFLGLMRRDHSRLLLPCYRDMDPYDLPEQLGVLQSYDMSRIGFLQDLTHGVNKVLGQEPARREEPPVQAPQPKAEYRAQYTPKSTNTGLIVGITVGCVAAVLLIAFFLMRGSGTPEGGAPTLAAPTIQPTAAYTVPQAAEATVPPTVAPTAPAVHTHAPTLVPARAATCTETGMEAYYVCDCGMHFRDAGATMQLSSLDAIAIPATGQHFDADLNDSCDICGRTISVFLLDLPYTKSGGKLWIRSESAPSGRTDSIDDARRNPQSVWSSYGTLGYTQGSVLDRANVQYTNGFHMDNAADYGTSAARCSVTFTLNGQYSTLTGYIGCPKKLINDVDSKYAEGKYVNIYVDGVLVDTTPSRSYADKQSDPFAVDVRGAQTVRFEFPGVTARPNEVATIFDARVF